MDSDGAYFTVDMLHQWKRQAEERSFRKIMMPALFLSTAVDHPSGEKIDTVVDKDIASIAKKVLEAAKQDLAAFKNTPGWPRHAIQLNLRMSTKEGSQTFDSSAIATAIETFNEIVVIAPPGTGKTTTLLQVVDATLSRGLFAAAFIPLGEWSSQKQPFLESLVHRYSFCGCDLADLQLLARHGRLLLVMDGWNELDAASRQCAMGQMKSLRRDFPELGILLSSRRQALDLPIEGPLVEIEMLSPSQQCAIARAARGDEGEELLDHAWRTPGIRDLVTIPLYLAALLKHNLDAALPTTKEQVLRMFVTEHERVPEKAEVLREAMFGHHSKMLEALAIEATRVGSTTLASQSAVAAIGRVEECLISDGSVIDMLQPSKLLDVLVSHHVIVRSGDETGGISFQHQQFQEWYASFEVERMMLAASSGQNETECHLKSHVLNQRTWEEAILFACERASRSGQTGIRSVAKTVLWSMAIDPLFAAELISRASEDVWRKIAETIVTIVDKWHVKGQADRAVDFMVTSGRGEFADQLWPLIAGENNQLCMTVLRAGRVFNPAVLGSDAKDRLASLSEEKRRLILSELASWSGIESLEFAANLASIDPSSGVKTAVCEHLLFRHADRLAAKVMQSASDDAWSILANKGDWLNFTDPACQARLTRARQMHTEPEPNLLKRLESLTRLGERGAKVGQEMADLIEKAEFPVREQYATWHVEKAYAGFPIEISSALRHRLEVGREIPVNTGRLLPESGPCVDIGPIAELVIRENGGSAAAAAVAIVGPKTVAALIDAWLALKSDLMISRPIDPKMHAKSEELQEWISRSNATSFIQAIVERSEVEEPSIIAELATLVARHGKQEGRPPIRISDELHRQICIAIERWADILVGAPESTREQMSELAQAIERLPTAILGPPLLRLLASDLARRKVEVEQSAAERKLGRRSHNMSHMSYVLQYRHACAAIGSPEIVQAMKQYLPDLGHLGFGVNAACVLKDIWDREHHLRYDAFFIGLPDFTVVKNRRAERERKCGVAGLSSPFADAIFAVIDELMRPDASNEVLSHVIQLATVACSIPYGERPEIIEKLSHLSLPIQEKRGFFKVLILAGELVSADLLLEGIKSLLDSSSARGGSQNDNWWQFEEWLELFPFCERPLATFDALKMLKPSPHPWRLRRLLSALGNAPSNESLEVLDLLARSDSRFQAEHDWLVALERRGDVSSARILLDLICAGPTKAERERETWGFSRFLSSTMRSNTAFREEIYKRYEGEIPEIARVILARAIAEAADCNGVTAMVRNYVKHGQTFDAVMHDAVKHVAIGERPSDSWAGANEIFGIPVPQLRKELFSMMAEDSPISSLAESCLTAIDKLREDYGVVEEEPRHPDIDSGRSWPLKWISLVRDEAA